MVRSLCAWIVCWSAVSGFAAHPNIYEKTVNLPLEQTYKKVYNSLENNKFFVLFEAHISDQMARFKERWGADYNRNQLSGIRNLVICNIWYVNQVANLDPDMLALCPLRIALVEKGTHTRVLFAKPTALAQGSPALPALQEVEAQVIGAIEQAFEGKQ